MARASPPRSVADRAIVLSEGEVLDHGPWAAVRKRAAERGWLPADA
jgi:ABC-2 type transport system ATP-binding protein